MLHAEQALAGRSARVVEACDRNGSFIPLGTLLSTLELIVLRYQDPHEFNQITITMDGQATSKFWANGTRIFQMCDRQPRQIPINEQGQEIGTSLFLGPCPSGSLTKMRNPMMKKISSTLHQRSLSPSVKDPRRSLRPHLKMPLLQTSSEVQLSTLNKPCFEHPMQPKVNPNFIHHNVWASCADGGLQWEMMKCRDACADFKMTLQRMWLVLHHGMISVNIGRSTMTGLLNG